MAITSVSYPRGKVWTKDPLLIGFSVFLPAANDMLQLQVFDQSNNLIIDLRKPLGTSTYPSVSFDLSQIADAKTKFQAKPSYLTGAGIANVEQLGVVPNIYAKYRQSSMPAGLWITGAAMQLYKGGISSMNFTDDLSINGSATASADWLPTPTRFLTWLPSQKLMSTDEMSWLTYLSDTTSANQQVQYVAYYTDGTQQTIYRPIGAGDGAMFYIPSGLPQIGFSLVGRTIAYWTVVIVINNIPTTQKMTFYADSRPSYSALTLYYRNSLGGWDNFRFKGEYTSSVKAERKEYSQLNTYTATNGTNNWFDAQTRISWKANTGYVARDLLYALEDAFASTECALLVGGKWLPVRVTSEEFKYKDTQNGLYSETLEFETAGTFSNFPKQLRNLI